SVAVALAEPAVGQPKGSAGSYGRHAWRIRGIARLQEKRSMQALPTYDDVVAAAQRIEGHAHRTPVMRSGTLARETGAEFFFKCENFQRVGAFKFRGAFNALSRFNAEQKKAGVIAFSSGNHAQAIA